MEQQNFKPLSDKAFARLILTSVLGILICLICLCGTSWAWFTDSNASGVNQIKSADNCLLSVSVYKDGAEEELVKIDTQNPITLKCEGMYTVTLMLPKDSSSGYLVLTVGGQKYYSDYLQRNNNSDQTLTFKLNVATAQDVTFTARWGIYSGEPDVEGGGQLNIE